MNYYNEIKNELINNEIYKRVKDYSKNRNELSVYYNVGKLLSEAGKHYGEGIIKEYSRKLTIEIGSGYGISNLKRMRQFYLIVEKGVALPHQLSWSHILAILPINNINEINYYISISMLVPIVISGPMAKICVRMMTNQNFPQKAKHFKKKIRILFALITLWVLTMLILSQTGWLNFKIVCMIMIMIMIICQALVWTMRCPQCGAWVASQTPIWRYRHFKCCRCGFDSDNE